MSHEESHQQRLEALRRDFDDAFAREGAGKKGRTAHLLEVAIAGVGYVLDVDELRGVHASPSIVSVPTSTSTWLGLTAIRGVTFAVHDLAALLGHPNQGAPTWLVIARAAPIAFAFASLSGQLRVAPEAVVSERGAGAYVRGHVEGDDRKRRQLIDIAAMLKHVTGGRG